MTIQTEKKQYNDFLSYLKSERPEFYRDFRRHYNEKRGAFPEMTEQQYLLWVSEIMERKTRTKLQSLDESLVNEDEVKRLEEIIKKSKKLQKAAGRYAEIQRAAHIIPKKDKKKLEEEVAKEMYEEMNKKDKKDYDVKKLVVYISKLNIGPWTHYRANGHSSEHDIVEFIAKNKRIFENNEDIAVRILGKYCEQQLQSERNNEDYRDRLDKILDGEIKNGKKNKK